MELAEDSRAAEWLTTGLRGFAESVCSLVPCGFPAYVRVFHPAERRIDAATPIPVRWREIASATGTRAHPAMQLPVMTGVTQFDDLPGVYDYPPEVGSLPPELAGPLAATLAEHTNTPDRCWFAVWSGHGWLPEWMRQAPIFQLPHREYYLLTGPIDCAADGDLGSGMESANLWWPEDQAWCVATEIDLNTTYVGCDEACRDEILALPGLETAAIDSTSGISRASDFVNADA